MTNKKAIILGSGFSRAIINEMPLTNDLTNKISEKFSKIDKKGIDIVRDLWDKHIVAKNIGGLKDFEKILSYLEDAPWKDNITKYEHLILYETLTGLISDILSDITKDEDFFYDLLTKKKAWLKNFIKRIRDEKIPIITFNYDTILEWLLIIYERMESGFDDFKNENDWWKDFKEKRGGNAAPHDQYGQILRSDEYRANYFCDTYAIKTESFYLNIPNGKDLYHHVNGLLKNPRIFKLHGSLNWLYSNKRDSIIVDDREFLRKRFFKSEVFENMGRTVKSVEDIESDFKILKKGFQTLIIPPIQNKTATYMKNDYIGQQWLEVREILSQVEELDIIGYSNPTTDISTNLMMQDAVNRKDCKINICYFEKDKKLEEQFKERFKETFSLCDLQEKDFYNSGFDEEFCKKYI